MNPFQNKNHTMSKDLMKLGKLLDQEHQAELKIRELKKKTRGSEQIWGCIEYHDNGMVLHVGLKEIISTQPETKPSWHTFETVKGGEKGYHRYGPVNLGEIRKGYWFWIKHETASVEIRPDKTELEPAKESEAA